MRLLGLLILKELRSFFYTPYAYVLIGFFTILSGLLFTNTLQTYLNQIQLLSGSEQYQISFEQEVIHRFFGHLHFILIFLTPLLTMKLMSDENKTKTIVLLQMSPLKNWQIIIGKFSAVVIFFSTYLLVTFIYPSLLLDAGWNKMESFLWGYFSIICVASCYFAFGLLCSTLTQNSIIAALMTFVIVMFVWMLNWMGQFVVNYQLREILSFFSVTTHYDHLAQGNLKLSSLLYFFSLTFYVLFLTVKAQSSERWAP